VKLNEVQLEPVRNALGGYLRAFEAQYQAGALADYFLFPGDYLSKGVAHRNTRPISRQMVGRWFSLAEKLAGVPHIEGRGGYGLRRVAVNGIRKERASEEATKAALGWSSLDQVATYGEDQPEWAMQEASDLLLLIRRGD
jgi:hypothetical protein